MDNSNKENRRPLTEKELEWEAENLWANEDQPDANEDIFGDLSDEDEDYVLQQQSNTDNEQSEDEEEQQGIPVSHKEMWSVYWVKMDIVGPPRRQHVKDVQDGKTLFYICPVQRKRQEMFAVLLKHGIYC